jgi:hypothetical protein
MDRSVRKRKVYYSVSSLSDGTIWGVLQGRKPKKRRHSRALRVDEDGIHTWTRDDIRVPADLSDRLWIVYQLSVATTLNVKRALRAQVEARLKALENQLDRIEKKLAALLDVE